MKIFTVEEANGLLPQISQRLRHLLSKRDEYSRRHDEILMHELLRERESHLGSENLAEELEQDIHALEGAILGLEHDLREIRKLGCVIRNLEKGFVDFPGRRDGKSVYFCWKLGEASIRYYHSLKGELSKRIPIDA